MRILIDIIFLLYIAGWLATYFHTSAYQEPTVYKKIKAAIVLFFIWWYIQIAMMRQGDL